MHVYNDASGACCASIYKNLSALHRAGVAAGTFAERNSCASLACCSAGVHQLLLESNVPSADLDSGAHCRATKTRQRRPKRPPPGFITVSDLIERSGVAASTAYHWIESRR